MVVAFPVVAAGIWLINYALPYLWHAVLAHHTLHNPVHMPHRLAWLGTYLAGFRWQPVVIGILAGLVVHRVYAPAGNTVQLYFIGRSVDRTRDAIAAGEENPDRHLPRWPWPPLIRERAAWIMQNNLPVPDRTRDIRVAVRVLHGRPGRPRDLRRLHPLRGGQGTRITRGAPARARHSARSRLVTAVAPAGNPGRMGEAVLASG